MELENVNYNILVESVGNPIFKSSQVYSVSRGKISHILLIKHNLYVNYGLHGYLSYNLYNSVNIKTHESVRRLTKDALDNEI